MIADVIFIWAPNDDGFLKLCPGRLGTQNKIQSIMVKPLACQLL
jgi:hypothetical protein